MSYNLLDYGLNATAEELSRRDRIHQLIRSAAPDVLAVQEIRSDGPDREQRAAVLLHELAEATGLTCELPDGRISLAPGNVGFHVAVLWRPGITALAWDTWAGTQLWHCLGKVILDIDGRPIAHASFHAAPFGRARRADESERVVSIMTRPETRPPGLIGGDYNGVFADRVLVPGYEGHEWMGDPIIEPDRWELYDEDPYIKQEWHPDFVYQCHWEYDNLGRRRWWADRDPGEVLAAGGLVDSAAQLRAPWEPTVGHWPTGDPFGPRRIDAIKVTGEIVPALRTYRVINTDLAMTASDHLPVVAEYAPAEIAS